VFLDRDGTLIHDRPGFYLRRPEQLRIYPYTAEALRRLRAAGFKLVLVSNQSGIGRGYLDHAMLGRIHRRLLQELRRKGARLDGFYFCPHGPWEKCACRKPSPYLARKASRELGLSLRGCYVVGDKKVDVDLARALGAESVHVLTGHGRSDRARHGKGLGAVHRTSNLLTAANWIVRHSAAKGAKA
jgi:histidinol-phosphate phosphatase family protein